MSIVEIERRKAALVEEQDAEKKRHDAEMARIREEYRQAEERGNLMVEGLDGAKILHAEHIIYVRGLYEKAGDERSSAREGAIRRILAGGSDLKSEYVGTKSYDRWHGQSVVHSYGMGPRHGSMIFEIGLTRPVRERTTTPLLTEEEIESAVYYLRALEKIQAAAQAAKDSAASKIA